jgi:exodeoxyribonuclease VII large subunit
MQGDSAANEVRQAIELAHEIVPRPDVMVITRGGGSIEDLWAFNDEQLVRKIHAAEIPVVSAIGHEIDVTLCDLVADLRALTPSEAAERMVPSQDELRQSLRVDAGRLQRALHRLADRTRLRLDAMLRLPVFRRPWDLVNQRSQYLDESQRRISQAVQHSFSQATRKVEHFEKRLDALNPKAVLGRGYSITMHSDGASVVRSADGIELGSKIHTVLASGELVSEVTERRVKDQGS